jgi:hypothetical protein
VGKSLAFLEKRAGSRVSISNVGLDFLALAFQISQLVIKAFGGIILFFFAHNLSISDFKQGLKSLDPPSLQSAPPISPVVGDRRAILLGSHLKRSRVICKRRSGILSLLQRVQF